MEYNELLKKAMEKIPKQSEKGERFNPPEAESFIEGNKTILKNLNVLANYLNRDIQHMIKFLAKELATSGTIDGNRVIFVGKFKNYQVNEKVQMYIKSFVRCKECNSPDTKIVKEDRFSIMHCMACQARHPVPKVN